VGMCTIRLWIYARLTVSAGCARRAGRGCLPLGRLTQANSVSEECSIVIEPPRMMTSDASSIDGAPR
jgi:hypothetical protein